MLNIMAIPLSRGLFALVDGKDYERLAKYKWHANKIGKTYYAFNGRGRKQVSMHRLILGLTKGDGKLTDHQNHCGLDNRKCNIRICTHSENQHNLKSRKGSSKYKGVCWYKRRKKWYAYIHLGNKSIHLGSFYKEIDAARAYDQKAKELFGEFALTNFGRLTGWDA